MSDSQKQAIYRFITVAIAGAVSAALLNLGPLLDLVKDPVVRAVAIVVLTGILQAILKLVGGATQPLQPFAAGPPLARDEGVSWWAA